MRLIKNQNTIRHIMHFTELSTAICIDRFKKLNCRCNDKRRIPIFRSTLCRLPIVFTYIFIILIGKSGLMAQYLRCPLKQFIKDIRCLVYNTVIWNDIDNALFPGRNRPFQRNLDTCQSFPVPVGIFKRLYLMHFSQRFEMLAAAGKPVFSEDLLIQTKFENRSSTLFRHASKSALMLHLRVCHFPYKTAPVS